MIEDEYHNYHLLPADLEIINDYIAGVTEVAKVEEQAEEQVAKRKEKRAAVGASIVQNGGGMKETVVIEVGTTSSGRRIRSKTKDA